jgi:CRP-like cAMP-binding protein
MPVDIDSPEGHIIRKMVPFSTMPNSIFKVICDKIVIETARSGAFLFKRHDTKKELFYLLKGEVSLEVDKLKMEVIKAGTESARFALAHQLPRKVNGVAKGAVQFIKLNSIYITTPDSSELKKHNTATAANKDATPRWMSTLLMIPVLRAMPPEHLIKISECAEEVNYAEGETVIWQGDVGEYFYLIKNGECVLTYKGATPEQRLISNKLKTWDSFGAEALISDSIDSHTVTALTELSLLKISKENFLNLIKQPSLKFVNEDKTNELLGNGGVLLDVRPASEYEKNHSLQAINAPLLELRDFIEKLDKNQPIVIISDDLHLSEAAAFLLLSYKFAAHVSEKNTDPAISDLIIKVRKPKQYKAPDNDIIIMESMDEDFVFDNNILVETRPSSMPTLSAQPITIEDENAQLKQQLQKLQLKLEKTEQEKQEISQKYQSLLKQTERLKAMLASLTKYNGMI